MKKLFLSLLLLTIVLTAQASNGKGVIEPYAANVARVIQDFEQYHLKKHQRPEKFAIITTGNSDESLLWVSTFDESYGCLFTSVNGKLEHLLNVGYNAQGEHIDLAIRNGVMIVTTTKGASDMAGADFYRFKGGRLESLNFSMQVVDGNEK